MNIKNKPVKKEWLKPQIMLLATGYVTGGAQPGHYENNASQLTGGNSRTMHTPGGSVVFNKTHPKSFYQS